MVHIVRELEVPGSWGLARLTGPLMSLVPGGIAGEIEDDMTADLTRVGP